MKPNSINRLNFTWRRATALAILLATFALQAFSQSSQPQPKPSQPAPAAKSGELRHYNITVENLPAAQVQRGPVNFSRIVPKPAAAELTMPPGFSVSVWAEGDFTRPRWLALAPNGDVFVAEPGEQPNSGRVLVLRDRDNDGKADERFEFASRLMQPFGMAFWRDYVYVANTNAVVRFKYKPGQTKAEGEPENVAQLPGKGYREHWTRNIIFNAAGTKMYISVGSQSNVDAGEETMRAAISEYNPDGTGHRIYASGTRNPIGLAWNPRTRQLWSAVQERDLIGDDLVPDYVTSIKEGAFYGWPYAYVGPHEDPRRKGERPDLVAKTAVPDVLIQAHSAVLGLVFYEGRMFPADYRGDAFVALHGSWNRSKRTGYKIIRIRFKDGKPIGGYDDFITGWMLAEDKQEVWGRPVGLLVLKDGSMLITDDGANKIWRVSYSRK